MDFCYEFHFTPIHIKLSSILFHTAVMAPWIVTIFLKVSEGFSIYNVNNDVKFLTTMQGCFRLLRTRACLHNNTSICVPVTMFPKVLCGQGPESLYNL